MYWTDGGVLSDDPAHFAIVANNDHYLFTKDTRTVHVNGKPIADADPATFRVLQGAYAQDARHVFYFSDPIVNADAASFHPLDGPYASDLHRVYWMGTPIDGADPATFRVLNAAFECSADAERAYYRQSAIAGRGSADVSARPRRHELHRDGDLVYGVIERLGPTRGPPRFNYPSASTGSIRSSLSKRAAAPLGMKAAAPLAAFRHLRRTDDSCGDNRSLLGAATGVRVLRCGGPVARCNVGVS